MTAGCGQLRPGREKRSSLPGPSQRRRRAIRHRRQRLDDLRSDHHREAGWVDPGRARRARSAKAWPRPRNDQDSRPPPFLEGCGRAKAGRNRRQAAFGARSRSRSRWRSRPFAASCPGCSTRASLPRSPRSFTVRSSSTRVVSRLSMRSSGQALGPSDLALAGSGWVSMNRPATPVATAARASTGTNSRWPPELVPCPPGSCTLVGRVEHHRAAGLAHDRQAAHVGDEVVVAERGAALAHHDRRLR